MIDEETVWPDSHPNNPLLIAEAERFSAELDGVNREHRRACSDIANKYIKRYSAIGRGEVPPPEPMITLTRPTLFDPSASVSSSTSGFGKL